MTDEETIRVYNSRATDYAKFVSTGQQDADLRAFIEAMPEGGLALDLGCGPGNSAAQMRDAGLRVEATDASPEMVRFARDNHGLDAKVATFDELEGTDVYDGIWANFSLLHAPKADMPRHLQAIRDALKPGGVFHIGTKLGKDSARDAIGRMYSYYSVKELIGLLKDAGFSPRTPREGAEAGLDGTVAPFVIILSDG